jgi:hypothetical protein
MKPTFGSTNCTAHSRTARSNYYDLVLGCFQNGISLIHKTTNFFQTKKWTIKSPSTF